ncbi:LTA synthase family protein [Nitrincola sp. MINF-07-Sa-05]|uniref:LTA synthase family protein n=1 Tax=Nitrincola salilacus TaxID=3400273 RepID=UPI003917F5D4
MKISKYKNSLLRAWDFCLIISFSALLVLAFLTRDLYVDAIFGDVVGCDGCFTMTLLAHDIIYLSGLLLIFLSSFLLRTKYLYLPVRLLALTGVLFYMFDIAIMQQFFTRLMIGDIRQYGDQLSLIWRHVQSTTLLRENSQLLALASAWVLLTALTPPRRAHQCRSFMALMILPAVGVLSGFTLQPTSYVHDWALRNVVMANTTPGVAEPYSEKMFDQLANLDIAEEECRQGRDQQQNIVLLILESWSPYQSQYWSGINNWTPKLDQLALENLAYKRYFAGGFTTNEGLISLLAGIEFISPIKRFFSVMPFETAWGKPDTLPNLLNQEGYHTAFLTSGNLAFSHKDKWLESIGFDFLEGHDYAGYEGHPRLHFDAVPDDVLYERSMNYISDLMLEPNPFFVTVENVSSHHPFVHPYTGERSEEAVFRFMDDTAYEFYLQLRDSGFFENGLLVIVSDHRAMIPISSAENRIIGKETAALIPALVISDQHTAHEITQPYHQKDLLPTLVRHVSETYCSSEPIRDLLSPEDTEESCLFHARGDDRDHINAICPDGIGTLALSGDDSRFIRHTGFSQAKRNELKRQINHQRVIGHQREAAYRASINAQ